MAASFLPSLLVPFMAVHFFVVMAFMFIYIERETIS
ncbi:photosystem I reaction center subunit VIII [Richelia intracellularis]|nr:photosystem I reaction center subunit VIII [Richelia intracellularis]HAE05600.1 photosystem I reaction center subunit VIII [Richelia sp.]